MCQQGDSALMMAMYRPHPLIIDLLIKAGAHVDEINSVRIFIIMVCMIFIFIGRVVGAHWKALHTMVKWRLFRCC